MCGQPERPHQLSASAPGFVEERRAACACRHAADQQLQRAGRRVRVGRQASHRASAMSRARAAHLRCPVLQLVAVLLLAGEQA